MNKLPRDYYIENDTLWLARDMIGKYLWCNLDDYGPVAGIIIETEAYMGAKDRASHAFGNRLTPRTSTMYRKGGIAYIYLCYGIHHLFNVVTAPEGIPHAVLVRGVVPVNGKEKMKMRTGKYPADVLDGPGKFTKAMGIKTLHNGLSLDGNKLWIEDRGILVDKENIQTSARIGVDYAGEDAMLPWRFFVEPDVLKI